MDGITNDLLEAQAIRHKIEEVHIYSGSWGPQDNGLALDGPGHLASLALLYGITKVILQFLKSIAFQNSTNISLKTDITYRDAVDWDLSTYSLLEMAALWETIVALMDTSIAYTPLPSLVLLTRVAYHTTVKGVQASWPLHIRERPRIK